MNKIQLAQLRDIAIEHLPAAQEKREKLKKHWASETTYSNSLYLTALMTLGQAGATAAEIAAAQLLQALGMWADYDPDSPELKEFDPEELREIATRNIGDAVRTLAEVTGRDMAHLMPADAPAAQVEAGTSQSGDEIPGKMPNTAIGKLAIKAAWQIKCETGKRATTKQVIARLQTWVDHKDNPNAVTELTDKIPNGVKWVTTAGKSREYDIGACQKTLETWNKSRA